MVIKFVAHGLSLNITSISDILSEAEKAPFHYFSVALLHRLFLIFQLRA
jgi:hypothetical protein